MPGRRTPSWKAELRRRAEDPEGAERIRRAFAPETGDLLGKSTVALGREGPELVLLVCADSTANLRAALNSYLRWLEMAERVDRLATGGNAPVSPA